MKWFFLLLLIVNVVYLGLEVNQDSRVYRTGQSKAIRVPVGTKRLMLLSELETLPEKRKQSVKKENDSEVSFNPDTVLPIGFNPNMEQMVDTLLPNRFPIKKNEDELTATRLLSKSEKTVCYTYGPISDEEKSTLMSDWLNERGIQYVKRQTDEKGRQMFWVYLAPKKSLKQAENALEDLKKKGVSDLRLIRSGDLLNTVSLGLFSSQAAVNRRLDEIREKGYQSVVLPYSVGKKVYWFDVRIVQNSNYVNELFSGFPSRFNAVLVNCDAIAMQ